jgi:DNA-binding NtrC family response regulator
LTVSPEALDKLRRHAWPGNVRELRNVIERAAVLCGGDTILPEHLPASVLQPPPAPTPQASATPAVDADATAPATARPSGGENLQGEIRALERARIIEALDRCGGNQSRAAEALGISRRTLVSRLSEFGLPRPRKQG